MFRDVENQLANVLPCAEMSERMLRIDGFKLDDRLNRGDEALLKVGEGALEITVSSA